MSFFELKAFLISIFTITYWNAQYVTYTAVGVLKKRHSQQPLFFPLPLKKQK